MNLDNKAARTKLFKEIATLVVVIVLIGVVTMLRSGTFGKPAAQTKTVTKIDTSFDTGALNAVEQKDKTYPNVTPLNGELGKSDPFAP